MKRARRYRIKRPRCWVVRWFRPGGHPKTDYLRALPGMPSGSIMTDRRGATEGTRAEALALLRARRECTGSRAWRLVRRGRAS